MGLSSRVISLVLIAVLAGSVSTMAINKKAVLLSGFGQSPEPPQNPVQKPEAPPAQKPAKEAAKEPDQNEDGAVRLSSRLVLVPVSASDAAGQPVRDLKAEDIEIEEEGKPQKVVALGKPGETPVEIALLFDVSLSIQGQFAFEQRAAVQFIKEVLKPKDAISVFSIGLTPKMVQARSDHSDGAIAGLMSISPQREPTAFFDSVVEAANYVDKTSDSGSRRVLVVISDGEENYSKTNTLSDALRELQKNDCLFYSINPTGEEIQLNAISIKGQNNMEAMATQTGGKAFNLTRATDLEFVFRQISQELQAQYLFGYYSTDAKAENGFKRITVRAPNRPELRIRARQGYYLSKSPHTP